MGRGNLAGGIASFFQGYQMGRQMKADREADQKKADLAQVGEVQENPQFTEQQGKDLNAAAASGQYDIAYDVDKGGYTITPKGGGETGAMTPSLGYVVGAKHYDTREAANAGRTQGLAEVYRKHGDPEGATRVTREAKADRVLDLQTAALVRADAEAGRKERAKEIARNAKPGDDVPEMLRAAGLNDAAREQEIELAQHDVSMSDLRTKHAAGEITGEQALAKVAVTSVKAAQAGRPAMLLRTLQDPDVAKAFGVEGRKFNEIKHGPDGKILVYDGSPRKPLEIDPARIQAWHDSIVKPELVKMGADDVMFDPRTQKIVAQGPGKEKFSFGGSGETGLHVLNTRTGATRPVADGGGASGKAGSAQQRLLTNDAVAELARGFGAKLDPMGKILEGVPKENKAAYEAAIATAEKRVAEGERPMAVASSILGEHGKKSAIAKVRGAPTKSGVNWSEFGVQ